MQGLQEFYYLSLVPHVSGICCILKFSHKFCNFLWQMIKVSVCIPTYNRANLLPYAVNSVLNQTYNDFELIITDDGSTDNTAEVVSQWNDSRIRYIRHPQNIGKSNNMRSGFNAATGEYFIKFDDDDGLTPDFLEKTIFILGGSHVLSHGEIYGLVLHTGRLSRNFSQNSRNIVFAKI